MKKQILLILSVLLSLTAFCQDLYLIKLNLYDIELSSPVSYKNISLFDNDHIIGEPFIDSEGNVTLIIDSILFRVKDSLYFSIEGETQKIHITQLRLLKNNKFNNINIKVVGFNAFTYLEYKKYCKRNGLIPRRKRTLAKDVIY
jgi:hypothetical protein